MDLTSDWDHLVTRGRFRDVIAWHKEIAHYMKSIDPYSRPVTTSTSDTNQFDEIFKLQEIDFVPKHFYVETIVDEILAQFEALKDLKKPYFVGEFSGGTDPRKDQEDKAGLRLHAGLWTSFMTPTAGAAMPWWWDIHIEKFDLYHHFLALSRFASVEDRRGQQLQMLSDKIRLSNDLSIDVPGIYNRPRAYLWFFDRTKMQQPNASKDLPLLPASRRMALDGMSAGTYAVQVWDTYTGRIIKSERIVTDQNGLVIKLPRAKRDFAMKIKKLGPAGRPAIRFLRNP